MPKLITDFKIHYTQAIQQINSFLFQQENWTGRFDDFPEGIINFEELGIAGNVDAALELEVVESNTIDGRIFWTKSCEYGGVYVGLLLEGRIELGGKSAEVTVYDFVRGRRVVFFNGQLKNDGILVSLNGFPEQTGLNQSRIAKNPEPSRLERWSELYCSEFIQDYLDRPAQE